MSDKRTFRTKTEYTAAVLAELNPNELALLNFTIYLHPKHTAYYKMFACGKFDDCWEYLMKHRGEMVIENVPPKFLEQAQHLIKNAIELSKEATAVVELGFIARSWLRLATELKLTPKSIPYIEMERAFFCGAYAVMSVMKKIGEDIEEGDEEEMELIYIQQIEAMWQECEAFKAAMLFDPEQN